MKKLEYHILKVFQEMMLKENFSNRYITIDGDLLCLIKTPTELDLYIKTNLVLDGRSLKTFSFEKILDDLYKVKWSEIFLYVIGDLDKNELSTPLLSKELELIRLSPSPLTNYLKTL